MRFVFSRRFFVLFATGLLPLSVSWSLPVLRTLVVAFDFLLVAAAIVDYFASRKLASSLQVRREFDISRAENWRVPCKSGVNSTAGSRSAADPKSHCTFRIPGPLPSI
jgi:hypothetical protein